jgi:N-acetylglucosaminyl-diphospho-decaprenol L-rhamnosyltransferase
VSSPTTSPRPATSDVAVVVASRNRRDDLLASLPRHEAPVVLVDNASTDDTVAVARAAGATVIPLDRNLGAVARNVGVAEAGTPYVAFADDDSHWEGDSLHRAVELFRAYPRAGLLAASVLVGEAGRLDPVSAYMDTAPLGTPPDLPGPSVLGFLACSAVVRREAFLAVGGFAPRLHVYGEEALLAMDLAAAGWGLSYAAELRVRHNPGPEHRDAEARTRWEVRNRLLTAWLRRPARVGVRAALGAMRTGTGRAALRSALRETGWVLRERRLLPPDLESAVAALDAAWAAGDRARGRVPVSAGTSA